MKLVLFIFFIFIDGAILNSTSMYNVTKINFKMNLRIDSLVSVVREQNIEISSLKIQNDHLKQQLMQALANDTSIWEFGSAYFGLITALIIIFGVIYDRSAKISARNEILMNFGKYRDDIKEIHEKSKEISLEIKALRDSLTESSRIVLEPIDNKKEKDEYTG